MANSVKQAGLFTLDSAFLYTYDKSKKIDIKNLILGFTISESMSKMSVRGSTTVFDGVNLMRTFPILGEEILEFTYTDYFGIKRTDTFLVYSVSQVKYPDSKNRAVLQYTLNFVSPSKVLSDTHIIARAYNSKTTPSSLVSEYAQEVYDEFYKRPVEEIQLKAKELVLEQTDAPQDLVIPNLSPEETMLFFARRAFSNNSETQTYRFFENRDKFYFVTNDYMENASKNFTGYGVGLVDPKLASAARMQNKTVPIFRYNYEPGMGPERQEALMYEIIDVNFGDRVNTINDLREGAYNKTVYEIDLMYGTSNKIEYDHAGSFKKPGQKLIHDGKFKQDNLTRSHVRYIFKDYASVGATTGPEIRNNTFYSDLYTKKDTYFYHYKQNMINVMIYGRNNIFAGSLIDLELPERSTDPKLKLDKDRSGRYFVESVENIFLENTYKQNLTLSRYGVGA